VKEALRLLSAGNIILPVVSSTASVNREVEKQNDLLLSRVMSQHYGMITQILQTAQNPQIGPVAQDYMMKVVKAADLFMKVVLRHFGHDEPEIFVPEPQQGAQGGQQPGGPAQNVQGAGQNDQMGQGGGIPGLSGMAGNQTGGGLPVTPAGGRIM
jgi:hypothetical protein